MRRSVLRWLRQRGKPKIAPLCLRTTWGDFAFRMRRAIDLDIRIDLGEITRAEAMARQITRPLASVEHDAPTVAAPRYWTCDDQTLVDAYATREIEPVGR